MLLGGSEKLLTLPAPRRRKTIDGLLVGRRGQDWGGGGGALQFPGQSTELKQVSGYLVARRSHEEFNTGPVHADVLYVHQHGGVFGGWLQ